MESATDAAFHNPNLQVVANAWHSIAFQHNKIFMRNSETGEVEFLCNSVQGGAQGNSLTGIVFCLTIDKALKNTEASCPGVEVKAIQDDISLWGDPEQIFGEGNALDILLQGLRAVGLEENEKKFQAYGTTETARSMIPNGLTQPKMVNKDTGEEHFGVWICGAAIGDDGYVAAKLDEIEMELCEKLRTLAKTLAAADAQVAHAVLRQSIITRIDYILSTHRPSLTRKLAHAMDETIRDCCLEIYGCDLLRDQEFPDNLKDESLTSERVQLKISQGGGGLRLTEPRALFLNSMSLALNVFRHAWPSLVSVFGNDSFQGSLHAQSQSIPPRIFKTSAYRCRRPIRPRVTSTPEGLL